MRRIQNALISQGVTCFLHLGIEDGSDHGHTATTSGSRFGLRLDLAQLDDPILDTPRNGAFRNILIVSPNQIPAWIDSHGKNRW